MVNIARIYERQYHLYKEDIYHKKAIEWYKKAETHGYSDFFYHLGKAYFYGYSGLPRNRNDGISWYKKAAEKGEVKAMEELVYIYYDHYSIEKNYAEALKWSLKLQQLGNTEVTKKIADMSYTGGYGIKKQYGVAIKNLKLLIGQNNVISWQLPFQYSIEKKSQKYILKEDMELKGIIKKQSSITNKLIKKDIEWQNFLLPIYI